MVVKQGDISLDGRWYKVLSYRDKDLIDFSPKASTPSASAVYSNMQLYQNYSQTDWRHGFGDMWFTEEMKYMRTEGNLDTRHDGIVMMFTDSISSDTNNNKKEGFCNWNNAVYAWGEGGLRKYSGGSWSSIYTTATVNFALPMGDYLFFCPDGLRIQKIDTTDTITDAGNDENSTDYKWLIPANGYVYAGKDNTPNIHRDSTEDLSDLEGTTTDTNIIYAGASGSAPTKGAAYYGSNLYIMKRDGMWVIGEDLIARRILDFSSEESEDNFRSWAVFNGYLVFPIRSTIYQWNGSRLSVITPPRLTDSFPYATYGRFDNFIPMGQYLYCTARTNESIYNEDLLCWDGVAWTKLMRLVSNGTDTISAMAFDTVNNYLWYHLDSTADTTYYIPFQSESEYPYANFPTSGTHELYLARWDMVYRIVDKSTPSILIEASNLTADRKLILSYALNGGNWVEWGEVTSNGVTELKYPGGQPTIEYKYISLKIKFVTDSASQSPILEGVHLRFITRPETVYGWSISIPIAKGMEIGQTTESRMPLEIYKELQEARNSKSPVQFIDVYGESYLVYITSISTDVVEWDRLEGGSSSIIEYVAVLNLVEVD